MEEISDGIAGIGVGFAFSALVAMMALQIGEASKKSGVLGTGADTVVMLIIVPLAMAIIGTMLAFIPMILVMGMERIGRFDLGAAAWGIIGLVARLVPSAILWGSSGGGAAIASGGIAGMAAHTMSRGPKGVGWIMTSAASLGLIMCMTPIGLMLPTPSMGH